MVYNKQGVSFLNIIFFFNAHCVAVPQQSDPTSKEVFPLWSEPRTHHVLNYNATDKSSSTQGFLLQWACARGSYFCYWLCQW